MTSTTSLMAVCGPMIFDPHCSLTVEQAEHILMSASPEDFKPAICPVDHTFLPGLYLRKVTMPEGAMVIGHEHLTRHTNVIIRGRVKVMIDGVTEELVAPYQFISEAGVRKTLYIVEETDWLTVHLTDETDIQKLEDSIIKKSETFLSYHQPAALQNES